MTESKKYTPPATPETLEAAVGIIETQGVKIMEQEEVIEAKDKQITELEKSNTEQEELISILNGKISKLESVAKEMRLPTVIDVKGVDHNVVSGAEVGGKKYTADEIANNPSVIEAIMVIEGQSIIVPVK